MNDDIEMDGPADPVRAFDALRGEVALLRRAVEALAAERTTVLDYRPSIETLAERHERLVEWMRKAARTPMLRLTPDAMAEQMAVASRAARQSDAHLLEEARAAMSAVVARVDAAMAHDRIAQAQSLWLTYAASGGLLTGLALGVALVVLAQ